MRRAWATAAVLAPLVGGCGVFGPPSVEEVIADGSALAAIRQKIDGRRQCQTLWPMSPIDIGRPDAETDSVRALVAAGLFRLEPLPANELGNDLRLVPTAEGRKHLTDWSADAATLGGPKLCYGRARVVGVDATAPPGALDGSGRIHYSFRVTDMPAWTERADVRRVFPALDHIRRNVLHARFPATISEDGAVDVEVAFYQPAVEPEADLNFLPRDAR